MQDSNHIRKDGVRYDGEKIDISIQLTQKEKQKLYEKTREILSPYVQSESPEEKTERLAHNWIYNNIDEVTRNCRKIYFIYLSLLSYSLLTVFTTPTQDLFLGQDVKLPIINANIPLQYFIFLIPLMAIGLFVYNQLYLVKVNKLIRFAIEECSKANPDCVKKRKKKCNIDDICENTCSSDFSSSSWSFYYQWPFLIPGCSE